MITLRTAAHHPSLSQYHFLHWQSLFSQGAMGNGVPRGPKAALEKRGCLVGFFLHGAPEGAVQPALVAALRRLADVDDDDVTGDVHHLTAGDEGGVVAARNKT